VCCSVLQRVYSSLTLHHYSLPFPPPSRSVGDNRHLHANYNQRRLICAHIHLLDYDYGAVCPLRRKSLSLLRTLQSYIRTYMYACMYIHTHIYVHIYTSLSFKVLGGLVLRPANSNKGRPCLILELGGGCPYLVLRQYDTSIHLLFFTASLHPNHLSCACVTMSSSSLPFFWYGPLSKRYGKQS